MFFKQDDIKLEVISVYKFNFENNKGFCDEKEDYMLSLRTEAMDKTEFEFGNKTYSLEKNDLIFIPPNNPYVRKTKKEELIVFHFRSDNLKNNDITVIKNINSRIADLFREGYKTAVMQQKNYKLKLKAILYSILFELNEPLYSSEVKQAIDLINRNYCSSDFRMSEVSEKLHMSESYLRKIFKAEMGVSPKRFCDDLRFARAAYLLKSDYLSVEEVSDMVGFSNAKIFSSAFRKRYGMPPSYFKKNKN